MHGSVNRDLRPSVHCTHKSEILFASNHLYYRLVKQMEWFSIRGKEWVSGAGIGQVSGDVGDGG